MTFIVAAAASAAGILLANSSALARGIVHDPVALNIGVNCAWEARCMALQHAAMTRSLHYVSATRPPQWKVQLCNRNANRGGYRVDWAGFDHCIHNANLRLPARRHGSRARH